MTEPSKRPEQLGDTLAELRRGGFDEFLEELRAAIKRCRDDLERQAFDRFKVGDRVRFNSETRPKRSIGLTGEVVEKRRTRLVVEIDGGRKVATPASLLDAV